MALGRVPPTSPSSLQNRQDDRSPPQRGGQSPGPTHGVASDLPRRARGSRRPEPHSAATQAERRGTLPASGTPARGAGLRPEQRRAIEQYPSRQLRDVMEECCTLPEGIFSAPPPRIESMSAHERSQLEAALMYRHLDGLRHMHITTQSGGVADLPAVTPATQGALQAWLMVQSARLRHIAPGAAAQAERDIMLRHYAAAENDPININRTEVGREARMTVGQAHEARVRPQYAAALNNFMRLLDPAGPLPADLRRQVVDAFHHHRQEGRISPQVNDLVEVHGLETLAAQRYRLDSDGNFRPRAGRSSVTPVRTPERQVIPRPFGEGSSSAARQPEPIEPPPALSLAPLSRRTARSQEPLHEGGHPGSQGTANRPQGQERPIPAFPQDRLRRLVTECLELPHDIFSEPPRGIQRLSAEQRTSLEQVLTSRFPTGSPDQDVANLPELRDAERHAMLMWLMVQSARLQTLGSGVTEGLMVEFHRQLDIVGVGMNEPINHRDPRLEQARRATYAPLHNAHDARTRPEYAEALNNFLRYFDPARALHPTLRSQVELAFNHQRQMGRISPQVIAMVDELGLETLAREKYRLNPATGSFKSMAQRRLEQQGGTFMRTPGREDMPSPSGASSSRPAEALPEPAPAQPELRLTPQGELWMNHILGLSRTLRSRIGKLPDSDQYQHIKSMPLEERNMLEHCLEKLFTDQGHPPISDAAEGALEAWLTTQRVRLRVHSEASIKRHEQATRHLGAGVKLVAAKLTGAQAQSENARFHSEHESADRPEYATAVNNFLRLLHPSTKIHPDLKQRIAERFIEHAEQERTISAPVLEVMRRTGGPKNMAAAGWQLDPRTNVISAATAFVENMNLLAVPTSFAPTPPRGR